eukprot:Selendium_serpulae@DN794_c0_g1_i1.p1
MNRYTLVSLLLGVVAVADASSDVVPGYGFSGSKNSIHAVEFSKCRDSEVYAGPLIGVALNVGPDAGEYRLEQWNDVSAGATFTKAFTVAPTLKVPGQVEIFKFSSDEPVDPGGGGIYLLDKDGTVVDCIDWANLPENGPSSWCFRKESNDLL